MPIANAFYPKLNRGYFNSTDSRTSSTSSVGSTISVNCDFKRTNGPLRLHELIAEREWDRALNVIRLKGRRAKKKFVVPCFLNEWKGKAEIYPLHQALSSPSVPFEVVEALIFAYPGALKKKESVMRRNCLHIALRSGVSDEIVNYLVEKYPFLVHESDTQGRIPLHYAVSNYASIDIIRKLIGVCPQSILAPDLRGWTSLHVGVSKCVDPMIIRLLISVCPASVGAKTFAGSNAMKIIELCPTANSEIFKGILLDGENDYFKEPIHMNIRQRSVRTTELRDCFV